MTDKHRFAGTLPRPVVVMDFNASTATDLSSSSTPPAANNEDFIAHTIAFVPFLLIQITVTLVSNGVLLMMIGRSFKSSTSLNIFLLSISIFNLVTVVNQVSLVVYILQQDVTKFPPQLCHLMSIVKSSTSVGITLLHLFISHHRLKIAKKPLMWQNTRKQAWLLGVMVWAIACAVAIFECVLHMGNTKDISSNNFHTCLWPGINKCTTRISLYVQSLMLVSLSVVSVSAYYFYVKAGKELKDNEIEKEYRLKCSNLVYGHNSTNKRRKLTTPERAVVSLFTIFTIHCITQLPLYIYGIIIHSVALTKETKDTANNNSESESASADDSITGSTHILLLLVSISFLTTSAPLVLACINQKFKGHVKYLWWYLCGSEDQAHEKFVRQITAKFPSPSDQDQPLQPPPPITNFEIFYTPADRSKHYVKKGKSKRTKTTGQQNQTQYLEVPGMLRPDRVSQTSTVYNGRTPRPSRVSSTSVSAGLAAVTAGLALSAPGHRIMINNFFLPDPNEALVDELTTLNLI